MKNPAWAANMNILTVASAAANPPRLVASVPNFEGAFLQGNLEGEKPQNALNWLKQDEDVLKNVEKLLDALVDHSANLPSGAVQWNDLEVLGLLV